MLGPQLATVGKQLQLLVLALDAALYPTLLAVVVILLRQPRRVRLLSTYLATGLIVSVGVGLALVFVLEGVLTKGHHQADPIIDLTVGGLALLLAVALATHVDARLAARRAKSAQPAEATTQKGEPVMQRLLARQSTPIVALAAVVINLPGAVYIVALKDVAKQHYPTATAILLVVAFNLFMFALAEGPLAGLILKPDGVETIVLRANGWLSRNGRRIAIVLCLVVSGFLIVRGIAHL